MLKKVLKLSIFAIILIIFIFILIIIYFEMKFPLKYKDEIIYYSNKYELAPAFVSSLINCESGFDKMAVSNKGARGLMQLMPKTAQWMIDKYQLNYSVSDLHDINANIDIGCCYLKYLTDKFCDMRTVIASYNAGEGYVVSWLSQKDYSVDGVSLTTTPFAQTNNYMKNVINGLKVYNKKYN